jgi:hypothetical protein
LLYSEFAYDPEVEYGLGDSPMSSLIFEEIAKEVYGNARLGVLLRQLNIIDQSRGGQYLVPAQDELSKEDIVPENHIFKDRTRFRSFYDERYDDGQE